MNLASFPLGQLPFASMGMLLWGLAAAIPVLIHLWNRRQQYEVRWAAMQFLLAAIERQARRLRLEQWLLLALRVAILVMLALALANPLWDAAPASPVAAAVRQHTVLVLDSSYSMAAEQGGRMLFDTAREEMQRRLRDAGQGDGFTLVLMSSPPRVVIGDVVFDADSVAEEIDALQVEHTRAELPATLATVDEVLERARQRHPWLSEHRVLIFSDLTRVSWEDIELPSVREQLADLAETARLSVIEIGQRAFPNIAVTALDAYAPSGGAGQPASISVTIRGYGVGAQRTRLEVLVDGRQIGQAEIDLSTGGESSRAFSHRFESVGDHIVEARVQDPVLKVDNHRWLSVPVPAVMRVLCVEGQPGAADFVALAIAPDPQQTSGMVPHVVGESALLETELADYSAVVLCNVSRLRQQEANLLQQYVRQGGGLIIFLGDRLQPGGYEPLTGRADAQEDDAVLPVQIGPVTGDRAYRFDPLGYEHPIVEPFRGNERAGLLTTPTWRYAQLQPMSSRARTVLAFDNGAPALIAAPAGQGRCLVLATAASPRSKDNSVEPAVPWSALASWPSFPPLLHEMLRYAVRGQLERQNLLVGEPLMGQVSASAGVSQVSVTDPHGTQRQVPLEFHQRAARFVVPHTQTSGVYRVQVAAGSDPQLFAVNVDPEEANLVRYDRELLPSQFTPPDESSANVPATPPATPRGLFRWLLAGVLVLVLSESALTRWFGGRGG